MAEASSASQKSKSVEISSDRLRWRMGDPIGPPRAAPRRRARVSGRILSDRNWSTQNLQTAGRDIDVLNTHKRRAREHDVEGLPKVRLDGRGRVDHRLLRQVLV